MTDSEIYDRKIFKKCYLSCQLKTERCFLQQFSLGDVSSHGRFITWTFHHRFALFTFPPTSVKLHANDAEQTLFSCSSTCVFICGQAHKGAPLGTRSCPRDAPAFGSKYSLKTTLCVFSSLLDPGQKKRLRGDVRTEPDCVAPHEDLKSKTFPFLGAFSRHAHFFSPHRLAVRGHAHFDILECTTQHEAEQSLCVQRRTLFLFFCRLGLKPSETHLEAFGPTGSLVCVRGASGTT